MRFYTYRVLILLVCIEYLIFQNEKVLALRSIDMVIRNKEQHDGVQGNDSSHGLNSAITNHYMKNKKNSALSTSINMVRKAGDGVLQRKNSRLLSDTSVADMKVERNSSSTVSVKFDSSKRRVRRGSDPIHNRS